MTRPYTGQRLECYVSMWLRLVSNRRGHQSQPNADAAFASKPCVRLFR